MDRQQAFRRFRRESKIDQHHEIANTLFLVRSADKCGVYSTKLLRPVLEVEYDSIEVVGAIVILARKGSMADILSIETQTVVMTFRYDPVQMLKFLFKEGKKEMKKFMDFMADELERK